jgi:phosphonate transport system substrate-binding protein
MPTLRTITSAAGALALGVALAACGSSSNDTTSTAPLSDAPSATPAADTTSSAVTAAQICPSGSLSFGVEPYEDAKQLIPAYQALAAGLGQKLGCKIDLQISDSYVAEILAMQNGKLDLGEFGPLGFVFANKQAGATALASFADKNGKVSSYTAGIWVPKGSSITSIKELAGHTLALSEAGSTSGDAVPREALMQAGVSKQVDAQYAGGHTEALEALTNGKVDAAEINSQTQASATDEGDFDASGYTEIWKSAPILNDPITAGPNMTPEVSAAVQKALLSLPSSTVSKIGEYLDFTPPTSGALVAVTKSDYQPLFQLASSLGLTSKDL